MVWGALLPALGLGHDVLHWGAHRATLQVMNRVTCLGQVHRPGGDLLVIHLVAEKVDVRKHMLEAFGASERHHQRPSRGPPQRTLSMRTQPLSALICGACRGFEQNGLCLWLDDTL